MRPTLAFEQLRAADVYVVRLFVPNSSDIYLATVKDPDVLANFMSRLDKVSIELTRDLSICRGSGAWTSFRSVVDTQLFKSVPVERHASSELVRRVNNAVSTFGFCAGAGQVVEHLSRDDATSVDATQAWELAHRVALEFARGWHVVATIRLLTVGS